MEIKKGYLVTKEKQDKYYFRISINNGIICDDGLEFYNYFKSLSQEEQDIITNYFSSLKNDLIVIDNPKVYKILTDFCGRKIIGYKDVEDVLFYEISDNNGERYGSELLTNHVFPIPIEENKFSIELKEDIEDVFDNNNGRNIYYQKGHDSNLDLYFHDAKGKRHTSDVYSKDYESYRISKDGKKISRTKIKRFKICIQREYIHHNMNRLDVVLIDKGYANQEEKSLYEGSISSGPFTRIQIRRKENRINKLSDLNNIKNESILVYHKDNSKRNSSLLDLINNIESLLAKIKNININLYNELNNQYQRIINEGSLIEIDKNKELEDFYNIVKNSITITDDYKRNIEFLNGYINKLFEDIINDRYPSISLDYLTELHNNFIKNEKNYTLGVIKSINGRMNILYFLYLYINKNNYDNEKIYASYIKSSIKGIVNVIEALVNLKVINYEEFDSEVANNYIAVIYKQDSITLPWILNLISNIKLNNIEKAKVLIK